MWIQHKCFSHWFCIRLIWFSSATFTPLRGLTRTPSASRMTVQIKMSQGHKVSNTALLLISFCFVSSLCAFPLPLNCTKKPSSASYSFPLRMSLACQADTLTEIRFLLWLGRAALSPASPHLDGAGSHQPVSDQASPVGSDCSSAAVALAACRAWESNAGGESLFGCGQSQ